jgi:hypothetical protein
MVKCIVNLVEMTVSLIVTDVENIIHQTMYTVYTYPGELLNTGVKTALMITHIFARIVVLSVTRIMLTLSRMVDIMCVNLVERIIIAGARSVIH